MSDETRHPAKPEHSHTHIGFYGDFPPSWSEEAKTAMRSIERALGVCQDGACVSPEVADNSGSGPTV